MSRFLVCTLRRSSMTIMVAATLAPQAYSQEGNSTDKQASSVDKQAIQEVIVTAQKRREAASKTPVSLTAMSADELQRRGVQAAEDLTNVVPNVQIGTSDAGNTNIYIRGIGSNNTAEAGDPAAAFHVDGVYLARPDQARNAFMDVERVEVLRGPQGTLYGRNATAGAVNVITNKPGDHFEARASMEIGSYDLRRAEGMVNVPINDAVALRAAILDKREENYIATPKAANNKTHSTNGRVHALFKLGSDSSWLVTADGTRIDGPESAGVPLPLTAQRGGAGQVNNTVLRADGSAYYTGLTSELNTTVAGFGLTWLASKHDRRNEWNRRLVTPLAPSGSENDAYTKSEQLSNEVRLTSQGTGPLRWVAGIYFFDEKMNSLAHFSDNFLVFDLGEFRVSSRALFGQATYSLTSSLRLTAGLRTTKDEKSCHDCTQSTAGFQAPSEAERDWSKTDWKLGIDYDLDRSTMVYAVAGTGYKAGGFNNATPAVPFFGQPAVPVIYYNPEQLRSVEAGIKGQFAGNRGRYTAAVFNYDYNDLQVSTIIPLGGGLTAGGTTNAATAKVRGIEADLRIRVGDDGTFSSTVALTKATYGTFLDCTNELTNARQQCSGNYLRNAPKFTLTLGYEHLIPLDKGDLMLRIDSRYSSKYYNDDANTDVFTQKSYTRTNLSARYNAPNDRWYVTAYARNLENRNVVNSRLSNTVFGAFGYSAAPRTIGMSVGTQF